MKCVVSGCCVVRQVSTLGPALGRCARATRLVLLAAAAPRQVAARQQAVPQPHPGVPRKLQGF